MAFAQKRRHDAEHKQEQKPWREQENTGGKRDRGDPLVQNATDRLDHSDAVSGLDSGPLELVVESGIFVPRQVEAGRVLHHTHADVACEAVGEQAVTEIDGPAENAAQDGEPELESNEPPKACGRRTALRSNPDDRIDDVA